MSANITVEHAKKIIRKLKAKLSAHTSKHHCHYDVIHNDRVILTFGVSHTPKKGFPQDHLPGQLRVNGHTTKCLAECSFSRKAFINEMENQGLA
jgi:hypothetical protein